MWAAALLGLLLTAAAWPSGAEAQDRAATTLEQIEDAFSQGDARLLMRVSADRVEVVLLGENTTYSRAQAVYVLESFFQQYPPARCRLDAREAARTDGSWFAAGHYWYTGGPRPLRLYIGLRLKGNAWELREVRIEDGGG